MKQRKFVSLLLAAAMALSLTACAGAPAAGSSTPAAPAAETAEEAAEPAAASDAFAGLPEKNTPATPVYASPDMYTIDLSKKVNINSSDKLKTTIKNLKAGKLYKFKIRPFTKVEDLATGDTDKVYGKWSEQLKAKTKK